MNNTRATSRPTARDGFVRGNQQPNVLNRRSLFFVLSLGLLVVAVLVQFGENGIFAFSNLQAREAELRQEVAGLAADNAELEQQLNDLQHEPEALEKLAREKHNMRRPEEEVLTVLPQPDAR